MKVDSKFTTTTQIVKLVGSHTISKISLRISDLKRTKMVSAWLHSLLALGFAGLGGIVNTGSLCLLASSWMIGSGYL